MEKAYPYRIMPRKLQAPIFIGSGKNGNIFPGTNFLLPESWYE